MCVIQKPDLTPIPNDIFNKKKACSPVTWGVSIRIKRLRLFPLNPYCHKRTVVWQKANNLDVDRCLRT